MLNFYLMGEEGGRKLKNILQILKIKTSTEKVKLENLGPCDALWPPPIERERREIGQFASRTHQKGKNKLPTSASRF